MVRSRAVDQFLSPILSLFQGIPALSWVHSISEALEIGDRIVVLKRPAMIAYDVSFDADTGREEREVIRSRIGDVLAA